ncbi:unnamed protein product [Bursaphelenchus okinawaensis]|uniref:Hexosyltransferase n=1 Tax=Bursaphelenchus okinawaensis TaxID=465554 RepID=A0A811JRE2_9BILA|nr:unnamed protein product [Bursaphelenchus okinawaensis]CAG9079718.1 unnamed protein product [Bursaphelenchus okinawaensis]
MMLFLRSKVKYLLIFAFIASLWLINVNIYNNGLSTLPYHKDLIAFFSSEHNVTTTDQTLGFETVKPNEPHKSQENVNDKGPEAGNDNIKPANDVKGDDNVKIQQNKTIENVKNDDKASDVINDKDKSPDVKSSKEDKPPELVNEKNKPQEPQKTEEKPPESVKNEDKPSEYKPQEPGKADEKPPEPVKVDNKPPEAEPKPGEPVKVDEEPKEPVKVDEKPQEPAKPDENLKEPKPNNQNVSKQKEEPPQKDEANKVREDFRPIGNPTANHTTVNTSVIINRTVRLETFVMTEKLQNMLVDVKATFKNYEVVYKMSKPDNESVCDGVDAVVYVMTMADKESTLRRQALRETIFQPDNFPSDKKILYRFVLGRFESEENYQKLFIDEIEKFNDIIFYNVEEYYRDNYVKWHTMHAWHTKYCSHVKHFIKMDDDTVADFGRMFQWMDRNFNGRTTGTDKYLICQRMAGHHPWRDPKADPRWYISHDEFPENTWPDYCYGYFVITTNQTVSDIMRAQEKINLVHMDDCFLTGIVRRETDSQLHDFYGIRTGVTYPKCSRDNVIPYMFATTNCKTAAKIRLRLRTIKKRKCGE